MSSLYEQIGGRVVERGGVDQVTILDVDFHDASAE